MPQVNGCEQDDGQKVNHPRLQGQAQWQDEQCGQEIHGAGGQVLAGDEDWSSLLFLQDPTGEDRAETDQDKDGDR